MTLEVAYGNLTQEQADRLGQAAGSVDGSPHIPGGAEPWVSALVHRFVLGIGARTVLETGCFMGATSAWIHDALKRLGGGRFYLCDIDRDRLTAANTRLAELDSPVEIIPRHCDALDFLRTTKDTFDLAWVDDNHEKPHVEKELTLLYPKMAPGGVILGHDVWGSCDLQEVFRKFGGYSINLPRLGAAGGIGIIQVHPDSLAVF
jgi:hypothetical protein